MPDKKIENELDENVKDEKLLKYRVFYPSFIGKKIVNARYGNKYDWYPSSIDSLRLFKVIDHLFRIAYQIPEEGDGYNARSFEDSWINLNRDFIESKKDSLPTCLSSLETDTDIFEIAKKIIKKTDFALDIIFSTDGENQWKTPKYIKEGLEWLAN